MTSASLEEEREVPALRPQRRAGPVLASVVLHGTLLYLFARVSVPPPEVAENDERPSVKVVIDMRVPPPVVAAPPAPEIPEPEAAAPAEPEVADTPAPATAEPAPVAETESDADLEETAIAAPEAWTPARIRSAIDNHATERRNTATTTWLTECILEQKEHGTRDCEQKLEEQDYASASMRAARNAGTGAFAGVVRPTNDWRMIQQFMRSNAMLEDIAEQGGVVAELATDRILINNQYMRYLQGNVLGYQGQDPMWQAMNSGFTADVLGGRQLSLPGNVPFRCGRGKLRPGLTPGGVGISDIVPCVFEFTGFTIQRPEPPAEANAFRVVPIVPGSRQSAIPANPVTP